MAAKTFEEIMKFNPYHDSRGRFASANTATSFTYRTKDPSKQHMADRAREREKERQAGGASAESEDDSPRMKTIHSIEDKIRGQFYETAAVVDKDGKVLLMKDGSENVVGFNAEECKLMKGATLTHNHPLSSMLSVEDAACFVGRDLEEMRATNREGITYSIKRGEGYTEDKGYYFLRDFDGEYKSARWAAQDNLDSRGFREKVMDGEITQAEANLEFGKVVAREMSSWCESHASNYGIKFTEEKRDVEAAYNVATYTSKSADDGDPAIILDQETNKQNDAAFEEWLNGDHTKKSAEDGRSILFIGLKINGAGSLAIKGGEDPKDFHVTLAYGYFNGRQHDESAIDGIVETSIKEIRDHIPDDIHFDAIGRFTASESSDGKDVIYAQVAAGQLEKAHDELLKALKKHGISLEATFPTYKPHMTLAYIDPGKEYKLSKINATGTATKVMIGYGRESSHEHNYTIMKTDDDKRLVFGWASVAITVDGEQLEDHQKDMIDPEDLEEAVYEYVLNFRDTGEEHIQSMRKKGKLVESCVFTVEKQKAMGIPEGILPVGWWIGFKIEDDAAWERVKDGTYKMFSIEGRANRVPVEKSRRDYDGYPEYGMWLEENLDATIEEQRAAEEHYRQKKKVAKTFDEILERG